MTSMNPEILRQSIRKGAFKPNIYLTNLSMAYFQDASRYVAKNIFPICPVQLSSARYYKFSKADLLRDNVQRKPQFGQVAPAQMGLLDESYACQVDQVIVGIDQIEALDFQRSRAPGAADPRRAKAKFIAEQLNLHQDIVFAQTFFKTGVWTNEWTGSTTYNKTNKTFIKFNDDNCDPVVLIDDLCTEVEQSTGRRPNRLALGKEAFNALKSHPGILERVKFGGSSANPATVNERVLAELFGPPWAPPRTCSSSAIPRARSWPTPPAPPPSMNPPPATSSPGTCWATACTCPPASTTAPRPLTPSSWRASSPPT